MNIDCISDLHGHYPQLEGGDLLIVAGDLTAHDTEEELDEFRDWLGSLNYTLKIFIGGNHDNQLRKHFPYPPSISFPRGTYLCDSGTEFQGFKIWGSPWTLAFEGMNPKCKAFTCETEEELEEKWALIPDDIDILVTHSPPWGVLDEIEVFDQEKMGHAGSKTLMETMISRKKPPKLWIWGHIHEAYGERTINSCKMVNASHVNEHYQPVNKPIRVIL